MIYLRGLKLFLMVLILNISCPLFAAPNNFIPNAPIINFKLPMFGKEGYRSWFVSGDQGIYVDQEEVDVLGMKICIFSGDAQEALEAIIQSPKATISINQNKASGKDSIQVTANEYQLSGRDWMWDGNLKKMFINKEVKVMFDQSSKNILSHEKK